MTFAHYVARARPGRFPFDDDERCGEVWRSLRLAFPRALGAVLMPNHLHLVARAGGEARLRSLLGAASRRLGEGRHRLWDPVPAASPLTSIDKLRRSVRYVWLNPCRPWRGRLPLVSDPLAWPWSTFADVMGAIVDPWTEASRVGTAFGWGDDVMRLHDYAMREDDVRPAPMPVAPPPSDLPDRAVDDVFAAALIATRSRADALMRKTLARRVAIGLAYRQGWTMPSRLAPRLGLRRSNSVSRIAANVDPAMIQRAALCLHPRLLAARTRSSIAFAASA